MMKTNQSIQVRLKESQQSKLHEIQVKLNLSDNSEVIRACIDMSYSCLFERDKYLIDFYNIKRSLLYKWLENNKEVKE